MNAAITAIVKGFIEGLVGFWREWRARRDLQLLERTKASLEGFKVAYRASEAARKAEQEGRKLEEGIDPEQPSSPIIRLPKDRKG